MQSCKRRQVRSFGTDLRIESGRPRSGKLIGGKASAAKIFCEGLTLLRKGLVEEAVEGHRFNGEFGEARVEAETKDGGVDFGWRREGFGAKCEEDLRCGMHLRCGREEAEVAAAGWGGDALGDLTLHHEDGGGKETGRSEGGTEQMEEDVRGDVVREVADDVGARRGEAGG